MAFQQIDLLRDSRDFVDPETGVTIIEVTVGYEVSSNTDIFEVTSFINYNSDALQVKSVVLGPEFDGEIITIEGESERKSEQEGSDLATPALSAADSVGGSINQEQADRTDSFIAIEVQDEDGNLPTDTDVFFTVQYEVIAEVIADDVTLTSTERVSIATELSDITNVEPIAQDDSFTFPVGEETLTGNVFEDNGGGADSDPNDDDLIVTAVNESESVGSLIELPSGASLTLNEFGDFTYEPSGDPEPDSFTYTVSDNPPNDEISLSDTATVEINVLEPNLVGVEVEPNPVEEGGTATVTVTTTDIDDGESVDYTISGTGIENADFNVPLTGTIEINDNTGTLEILIEDDALAEGEEIFNTAISFEGEEDAIDETETVIIDGNLPPVAVDDEVSTDEETLLSGDVFAENPNEEDRDPDDDELLVTAVNGIEADVGSQIELPSGALLTLNEDGTFDYKPNGQFESLNEEDDPETDTFNYTISDGNGGTDSADVTVTIEGVNDAPAIKEIEKETERIPIAEEEEELIFDNISENSSQDTVGTIIAEDIDGDELTFEIDQQTPRIDIDGDGNNPFEFKAENGELTIEVQDSDDLNFEILPTFQYKVSITDGNGGSDEATLTIELQNENEPPIAEDDPEVIDPETGDNISITDEDNPLAVTTANGILRNDIDPEGDEIEVSEVEGSGANIGTEIPLPEGGLLEEVNQDGSYTFNPNGQFDPLFLGEFEQVTFEYRVSEVLTLEELESETASVTITIRGTNDPPSIEEQINPEDLFPVDN
ncbi:MAG: hypothetical protein GVY17_02990 [Cyanobacteria bacterium]|jgi:VCBS repeat-containing protein|nr:hypothetical protein [Cyanobacteria bacterium GSL.Bin21]